LEIGLIGRVDVSDWVGHGACEMIHLGDFKVVAGQQLELALDAGDQILKIFMRGSGQV
jgi:hypothetical protein